VTVIDVKAAAALVAGRRAAHLSVAAFDHGVPISAVAG
jgi:hypothetical protein